jgi:hypothetical protein
MLLFRSEETVSRWCEEHGVPVRPLVRLEQLWEMAVVWYANRLTAESRRPAAEEMVGVFARIGLGGPFWDPRSDRWGGAAG